MAASRPIETEKVLDSRDIDARIEYLESELAAIGEPSTTSTDEEREAWDDSAEEREELERLLQLRKDCCSDEDEWQYGVQLINDDYFEEYAEELADDIGLLKGYEWPLNCIDWSAAAQQLQQDYSSVEFMRSTYWYRG